MSNLRSSIKKVVQEDWWDDMTPEQQAQYIKDHPGSKQAQQADTDKEEPSGEEPSSDQAVSALGSDGSDEQAENLYQLIKTPRDDEDPVLGQEHEVESDDGEYTYDSPGWEIVQNIARKARDSEDPAATFKKEFENAPPEVQEYILANIGKGKAESIKVINGKELNQETLTINGKQYRRINESVEKQPKPKYAFSEFYQRIKR